jgi:electron transfer flavoprotein alpha subunit
VRIVAVLDAATAVAARQARALGAFLREGLRDSAAGRAAAETVVFCRGDDDRLRLAALAPTRDVRVVAVEPRQPDRLVAHLAEIARRDPESLFLFAGGTAGTELATRLACATGGSALTDALVIDVEPGRVSGRRSVYSGHLTGRFELKARPWCVSIEAGWADAPAGASGTDPPGAALERLIVSEEVAADAALPPFDEVEVLEQPAAGDLEAATFLVVAGAGAGSRDGVQRIAAAAARMGAAFGVTRPVAMNAWAPMDRLIGVSGTRTAPALCIVAGAYGAPAFHWGIERAGYIVAINTDDHAPIVGAADATVVGDAVAVVEALADRLTGPDGPEKGPAGPF